MYSFWKDSSINLKNGLYFGPIVSERRCQNHIWFKNELQRLYIPISKTFSLLFILFLLGFGSPIWSQLPLEAVQVFVVLFFVFFFGFGKWSGSLHVLMFWYDADRDGSGRSGGGCKGVCCVYSVQIIACFSAFSIEHHKKKRRRKKRQIQHSHTITQKK